jgi:hypothetical protein
MPTPPSHYHVGIVVADLAEARVLLGEALGVVWGPVFHLDAVPYRDGVGADITLPTTICYSTGDPCLELIEEVPGSIWVTNEHSNLHHIGYWTDGLGRDSGALIGAGCPRQLCGVDPDQAPVSFAYHGIGDLGVRVELVDSAMRDAMSFLFQPDQPPT